MDFAVPVANPELLRTRALTDLSDLQRHVLLHAITWPEIWPLWLSAAGVPDLKPAGEMRLQNTGFTIQAAMNGLGIAMAHGPLISEELQSGKLIAPFRLMLPVDRGYCLVSLRDRSESPPVLRFRNWIRAQMTVPPEIAGAGI
jgi:LysR family glycine cleavage system transcriptional activator